MSSSDLAIRIQGLSKAYKIRHDGMKHPTFREVITHRIRHPYQKSKFETFWALSEVTFDVKRGDVVGIIGRNGAGKSTLLKILSRIVEPTRGSVDMHGRVGSLLEVGTGFHGELTGRENIFLNGAILGMRRDEIRKQFDAIVDFAEVERFLDTPVKRYSSGMYVRLAFAVAAHLNPEILIIDEVLAVGDAEFQKKCLGKMREVASGGRTVLFVSHNMAAIQNLCNTGVYLEKGSVREIGNARVIAQRYLQNLTDQLQGKDLEKAPNRSGNGIIKFTHFHLEDAHGNLLETVASGMDLVLVLGYRRTQTGAGLRKVDVGVSVHSMEDQALFVLYSSYSGRLFQDIPGQGEVRCKISRLPLAAGRYYVGARIIVDGEEADWPRDGVGLMEVEIGDFYGTGQRGFSSNGVPFLVDGEWKVSEVMNANGAVTR